MFRFHHRHGFSLLELSIVLVLVSVMAAFGIKLVPQRDCYAETREQMREIQNALEAYVRANNHYPAPSGRILGISDPLYGASVAGGNLSLIDRIGTDPNTAVLIGALPIVTLGLNSSYASDCWGNKFTYLVSEILATDSTYMSDSSSGQITIRTGALASPDTLSTKAAYAVISHGKDALGAVARNRTATRNYCVDQAADPTITRVDKENCDLNNREVFAGQFNDGAGAAHFYDDLLIYVDKRGYTGCNPITLTWDSVCSANIPAMAHEEVLNVNSSAAGHPGNATAVCTNGTVNLESTSCP